ncbi:hypothetical protein ACIQOW_09515 [Kitasatospora sp. NPDC091335]|uniref:hypothetical protein n=1 Tax=Kitasatospora sp. NPDC091335 TaxID=3364085 RepID=UPI003808F2C7
MALVLRGTVVTFDGEHRILDPGAVYVGDDGRLGAVLPAGQAAPAGFGAAPVVDLLGTGALVLPGLVDLHSHLQYNTLPLWEAVGVPYLHHDRWVDETRAPDYSTSVTWPAKVLGTAAPTALLAYAPVRFSLPTTRAALALVRADPALRRWTDSIHDAVETGEPYSQAFPLTDPEAVTAGLPHYTGPKVLIVDALTYSAADVFAAGFADNGADSGAADGGADGEADGRPGPVLGTAASTGAGGANVWTYELLGVWLPELLPALPRGAGFRIALRRATRAGASIGVPLEDFGVAAGRLHRPTRRDVLGHNEDLLAAAAALLRRDS